MEAFYSVTLLIVAALISNIISSTFDKIPLTFFEIASGFALSFLPIFHNYSLEPEMFMLCIIAPMLYMDGSRTDMSRFRNSLGQLFSMAVFLAIVTAVIMGFVFHALLPIVPITLSIVLAAIITPTDSLAFSSVTQDIKIPKDVSGALETESLFNDASGIVIFNLAIVAYVTGQFSLTSGLSNFAISFFGGIIVGLIAGRIFSSLQDFLISKSMDTSTVLLPLSLMSPIAIYLIAEWFHASGILAVVSAGILQGLFSNRLRLTATDVQLVINSSWQVVNNLLSGIVFVLLGVTIPTVISQMTSVTNHLLVELLLLSVVLYVGMLVIRFLWTRFNLVRLQTDHPAFNSSKDSFIVAIGGIHGTITLSMALSIPYTLSGRAFPFRDEIIFVATVVILLSLIVPTIILPLMLDRKAKPDEATFNSFRNQMVDYASNRVKQAPNIEIADRNYVLDMLASQKKTGHTDSKKIRVIMNEINNIQYQAMMDSLGNSETDKRIANMLSRRFVANPDTNGGFGQKIKLTLRLLSSRRRSKKVRQKITDYRNSVAAKKQLPEPNGDNTPNNKNALFTSRVEFSKRIGELRQNIDDISFKRTNEYLDSIESDDNVSEVAFARSAVTFRRNRGNSQNTAYQKDLLITALQYEYQFVSTQFKQEKIDKTLSDRLNQSIATDQMVYLQSLDGD
ncbi:cation:proton antiporter [Lentilactobacillus sp. SPB1-3]|uniref:Cation:proton antiporter n=1 Tax=Lentilactobacillus terminaliae TaxID=3003483 RepID=A0ACD5DEQ3_9LACO|nr:sodium:proton antiporter [Lentilactobacillus sp. SPB1-3]MCZ0977521.1 sodium:proton antiporter [Lentilactobacillus sp. SPB1-3]